LRHGARLEDLPPWLASIREESYFSFLWMQATKVMGLLLCSRE
jgi:hypothetical protein